MSSRLPSKWEVAAFRIDIVERRRGGGWQIGRIEVKQAVAGPFTARWRAVLCAFVLRVRHHRHPVSFRARRVMERKSMPGGIVSSGALGPFDV